MKRLLIDTNAYIYFKQGHKEILSIIQHTDEIGMSVVVLGELVAGFRAGTKSQKYTHELNDFLASSRIRLLPIDETTVTFYAQIYSGLRRKGKPIPTNDLWIAATALQHGCRLLTYDAHFQAIDNLIIATNLAEFLI